MRLDNFITCLYLAVLTGRWVYCNYLFAYMVGEAINQAIEKHNDAIREEFFQELKAEKTKQAEDKS